MMEWIKVGDSYPKDEEIVLIYNSLKEGSTFYDSVFSVAQFFSSSNGGHFEHEDWDRDEKPTHWSRMSEPQGED